MTDNRDTTTDGLAFLHSVVRGENKTIDAATAAVLAREIEEYRAALSFLDAARTQARVGTLNTRKGSVRWSRHDAILELLSRLEWTCGL